MVQTILIDIAMINWITGMILMMLSNASGIIKNTNYTRKGWKKYKVGYSIKEIKEVIELVDRKETKEELKKKIYYRQFSVVLLISTPILIFIAN